MRTKNIIIGALLLLVIYLTFIREVEPIKIVETITRIDTLIRVDTVVDTEVRYITKHLIKHDTINIGDTVYIPIPISGYRFKSDNYDIVAQGYNVQMNSITVFPEKHYINIDKIREITLPPPRLTHGINIGVGMMYGTKGIDVGIYAGYGLTLKF